MATYNRFENQNGENGIISDHQNPSAPPITNAEIQNQPKELKSWSSLKILVFVEFALAISLILFEAIIDIKVASSNAPYHSFPCVMGSGIWVGILGVITAGLGFGAFRSKYGHKGFMVANFVMCIICAIVDAVMIIFASTCAAMISDGYLGDRKTDFTALIQGLVALESLVLLVAFAHFISSIVSTAFICRNMCGCCQSTVIYYPTSTNTTHPSVQGSIPPPHHQEF